MTIPDVSARTSILRLLTRQLPLDSSVDLQRWVPGVAWVTGATVVAAAAAASTLSMAALRNCQHCRLAHDSHGYTGADLRALCREAAMSAVSAAAAAGAAAAASGEPVQLPAASSAQLRPVTADDFTAALRRVGPSMARGAAVELVPVRCPQRDGMR